eukprot:scaffold46780_cov33-Phaeocystis_antarctica.AAC.1
MTCARRALSSRLVSSTKSCLCLRAQRTVRLATLEAARSSTRGSGRGPRGAASPPMSAEPRSRQAPRGGARAERGRCQGEAADGDDVDDVEEEGPGWVDHPTAAAHGHLYRHRQK